jgi:thiamine pyrophosphokinase
MDLIKQKYPEQIFAFPAVKNETDSEFALLFALKFNPEKILLYGATGTRIDHIMANVNILLQAEEQGVNAVIRDAHNCVQLLLPKRLLHLTKGEYQFLSLLAFSEQVKGLQGTGLKYPLDNLTLMHGSTRGLSNELIEDSATISIDQGVLLVIESKD